MLSTTMGSRDQASGPTTRSGLQAAQLIGGGKTLSFMFNPDKLTIAKTNTYNAPTTTGKVTQDKTFGNGQNQTLGFTMFFDTYMDGTDAEDVRKYTNIVFGFMGLDPSAAAGHPSPPVVEFKWNTFSFHGVLLSVNQIFELFKYDGTPVRATLTVSMEEWPAAQTPGPTFSDPTALSEAPVASKMTGMGAIPIPAILKTIRMVTGTMMSMVAATEMASPAAMRNLASANSIEDPLHVPAGTPINIPANNPPPAPPPPPPSPSSSSSGGGPATAPKRPN